jgi:hypothetical protein
MFASKGKGRRSASKNWAEPVSRELAGPVADVLETMAEMREASRKAVEASRKPNVEIFSVDPSSPYQQNARAEAQVADLRNLVASRARSAGVDENELLAAAGDVIDGRKVLPAGATL